MAGKQKIFADDRWLMHNRRKTTDEGSLGKLEALRLEMVSETAEGGGDWEAVPLIERNLKSNDDGDAAEREEIDFEEIFEDDEGMDEIEEEDGEIPKEKERKGKSFNSHSMPNPLAGSSAFELEDVLVDGNSVHGDSLSKAGRNLKKSLQTYDAVYRSEDEDEDSDEENISKSLPTEISMEQLAQMAQSGLSSRPQFKITFPRQTLTNSTLPNGPHIKKFKMHPPQTPSPQLPYSASSPLLELNSSSTISSTVDGSLDPSLLLKEQDIISELRKRAMPTKELITLMKPKLKGHPQNKELFRMFLKKLAIVKLAPGENATDHDRLLELKKEYL